MNITGKSLSEALIFASTNLQYDDRLFIELQVQYMKIPSSNLGRTCCVQKLFLTFRTQHVLPMFCKRRASDKDLPVPVNLECIFYPTNLKVKENDPWFLIHDLSFHCAQTTFCVPELKPSVYSPVLGIYNFGVLVKVHL